MCYLPVLPVYYEAASVSKHPPMPKAPTLEALEASSIACSLIVQMTICPGRTRAFIAGLHHSIYPGRTRVSIAGLHQLIARE